jgi:hypothetical protein
MKKLSFAIALFFFGGSASVYAQVFSIGLKGGVSATTVQIDEKFDMDGSTIVYNGGDAKLGFHAGVYTRLKIPVIGLYLQPEVLYVSSGGNINVKDDGSVSVSDVHFSKIDVPVLLGIRLVKVLRLYAGPDFSFLINVNTTEDLNLKFKSTVIAYHAGVGLDLGRFGIDLKYEGNMSALTDSIDIGGMSFSTDMRNPQVILSLAWRL